MKRALVLGGGGCKGAYELGVYQALLEKNIPIDIVVGTSIGAMNGAMICQGHKQKLEDLWTNMTADQITLEGLNMDLNLSELKKQTGPVKNFIKDYINEKGADITPLKKMINDALDLDAFFDNPIEYGLVTTQFPSLKRVEMTKKTLTRENAANFILASASAFPAFPMCKIEDDYYIDGGYVDNVPIDTAIKLGATECIVVDLNHDEACHKQYKKFPNILYIQPSQDLGTMLNFNDTLMKRNIRLGYLDTLKALGYYFGNIYTIEKSPNFKPMFMMKLLNINARLQEYKMFNEKSLTQIIVEKQIDDKLDEEDFDLIAMELLLDLFNFDFLKIYTTNFIQDLIIQTFNDQSQFHYRDLLLNIHEKSSKVNLLGCMTQKLLTSENFEHDLYIFSHLYPRLALLAFYLYTLLHK